jgi:hypothetical protein
MVSAGKIMTGLDKKTFVYFGEFMATKNSLSVR